MNSTKLCTLLLATVFAPTLSAQSSENAGGPEFSITISRSGSDPFVNSGPQEVGLLNFVLWLACSAPGSEGLSALEFGYVLSGGNTLPTASPPFTPLTGVSIVSSAQTLTTQDLVLSVASCPTGPFPLGIIRVGASNPTTQLCIVPHSVSGRMHGTDCDFVSGPGNESPLAWKGYSNTGSPCTGAGYHNPPCFTTSGTGCSAAAATPMSLSVDVAPVIGTTMTVTCHDVPSPNTSAVLMLGSAPNQSVDLTIIGMPGCTLYVNNIFHNDPMMILGSDATVSYPFPNDPASVGAAITMQAAVLDTSTMINAFGLVLSDLGSMRLGDYPVP